MPFLSEELWQRLPKRVSETAISICVSQYPETSKFTYSLPNLEAIATEVIELVTRIRSVRTDRKILPKKKAIGLFYFNKKNWLI